MLQNLPIKELSRRSLPGFRHSIPQGEMSTSTGAKVGIGALAIGVLLMGLGFALSVPTLSLLSLAPAIIGGAVKILTQHR